MVFGFFYIHALMRSFTVSVFTECSAYFSAKPNVRRNSDFGPKPAEYENETKNLVGHSFNRSLCVPHIRKNESMYQHIKTGLTRCITMQQNTSHRYVVEILKNLPTFFFFFLFRVFSHLPRFYQVAISQSTSVKQKWLAS